MEICPSIKECNDCDILQCNARSFILGVKLCIFSLKQAEKEGKICKMPSEEEIEIVIYRTTITKNHDRISGKEISQEHCKEIAKSILDLLRGKK